MRDDAIHRARHTVDLQPRQAAHWIALARVLGNFQCVIEAIIALETAVTLLPDNVGLREELAHFQLRAGNLEEVVRHLRQARQLNPTRAHTSYQLGRAFARMGRFAEAESAIDEALAVEPEKAEFLAQKQALQAVNQGCQPALVPCRYLATSRQELVAASEVHMPRCLAYTNFMELNPEVACNQLDRVYVDRLRRLPAVALCRLAASAKLMVPSNEDFIPVLNNMVVAEQVRESWTPRDLMPMINGVWPEATIDGPVVLIARWGIRTWGHWLGELLPKLVAVETFAPGHFRYVFPDVLIRDPNHRTWLQSLEFYGIDSNRIAWVSPRVSYSAQELYAVSPVWSADRPAILHPSIAEWMRAPKFAELSDHAGPDRKIALLRRTARTRNVANLAEVEELLVNRGWTIVDVERLEFRQQVELFRNAHSVVSVLGSGLTGLIYCPKGVKVITLAPSHWVTTYFYALMQERAAFLVDIRGSSLAVDQHDPRQVRTASFVVPRAELETALTVLDAIGWRYSL